MCLKCVLRQHDLLYYTIQHETFHALGLDDRLVDHIDRDRCLYTSSRQNKNGCELVLEDVQYHIVLILQHCNFMLVRFMYFKICNDANKCNQ
jgi:hypothetical protein